MSPQLTKQWIHTAAMPVYLGGAELNVAMALANWGLPVKYCTILPDNYLSQEICSELNSKKIDTSAITFSGDRIGIYFLPQGKDLKNEGVIYDRACSSFSKLLPGIIDWKQVLQDCNWLHFSAITPALSNDIKAVCLEALSVAKEMGLTTSIDLNYRAKLWQSGILPLAVIPNLVKYCDVVMGNIWAMEKILGIAIPSNNLVTKNDFLAAANEMSATLLSAYPQCKTVANTFRFTSNESIKYYATINTKFEIFNSIEFETNGCSDMSGSGDCFMAGLIYGMSNNMPPQAIIDFAASAAVGKLQEAGDSTKQSIEQIKTRLQYE